MFDLHAFDDQAQLLVLSAVGIFFATAVTAVVVAVCFGSIPRAAIPIPLSATSCEFPSRPIFCLGLALSALSFCAAAPALAQGIATQLSSEEILTRLDYLGSTDDLAVVQRAFFTALLSLITLSSLGFLMLAVFPYPRIKLYQIRLRVQGSAFDWNDPMPMIHRTSMCSATLHDIGSTLLFTGMFIVYVTVVMVQRAAVGGFFSFMGLPAVMCGMTIGFMVGYDWGTDDGAVVRQGGTMQWGLLLTMLLVILCISFRINVDSTQELTLNYKDLGFAYLLILQVCFKGICDMAGATLIFGRLLGIITKKFARRRPRLRIVSISMGGGLIGMVWSQDWFFGITTIACAPLACFLMRQLDDKSGDGDETDSCQSFRSAEQVWTTVRSPSRSFSDAQAQSITLRRLSPLTW